MLVHFSLCWFIYLKCELLYMYVLFYMLFDLIFTESNKYLRTKYLKN